MNTQNNENRSKWPKLTPPNNAKRVLLHSCCAPCSGVIMEMLIDSDIDFTVFFYNPNIHPREEYEIRKEESIRFSQKMGIPFVDADYDTVNWFDHVKGWEEEPERGKRCSVCFDMRFERTAQYAQEHGFKVFTSTVGISRWKDMDQVNECGTRVASRYPELEYWTHNWRKKGGATREYEIAKRENFYKQEYCGCIYSLRDSNLWREQHNRPKIERGEQFYSANPSAAA
jgi:predicted adenine nucleotide alpha hydrolase (AANH) superfamily ATPase